MKALVTYIDFHWDNYQGGSGKTVETSISVEISETLTVGDVFEFIHKTVRAHCERYRPFEQTNLPMINH